jgi:hypothetical protein
MATEGGGQIESASGAVLTEGVDYYIENGLYVFTAEYLLKRGYCCQSGCRHCPYGYQPCHSERSEESL